MLVRSRNYQSTRPEARSTEQLVGSNTVANMHNSQALNGFQGGMPCSVAGISTTV